MANRIQLRRGSAQEWSNVNPTLAIAEVGVEIDTGRFKFGDGVTPWNSLRYERPLESVTNTPNTLVLRDADGNFSAGSITASIIGNASTATRLANTRQIALTGDVTASATFDGSANLNLSSALQILPTLPHYDGSATSSGTYTRVTVDAKGRIIDADNPTSLADYGLDGTVEGESAQTFDRDLQGIADLSTTGIITRVSDGNIATRTITGTAGRIAVTNGSGVAGNPIVDLIVTTVSAGTYNTPSIAGNTQTINATRFSVDAYGRFTYAEDFPIATAVKGTTASAWVASTAYSRYAKVTNSGRLYQALNSGTSGSTAPTHTSGDASDGNISWRYLATVSTRQKGLASFDQEDFDVDVNGHVTIAAAGVDNTQLQNNQIRFADGNSFTAYELDNELTASTGYRGITTINDLSVNNTSGSPLLKCLAADDNVDINTSSATIFSDIVLDKTSTSIQTISRSGSLTLLMDANTASNRFLRLTANNAGAGEAKMEITADDSILVESSNSTISITSPQQISLVSSAADVRVEDIYFSGNAISSTNSSIILDPAGVGDNTGTVQIKGNLLVDGTTVTVNSSTMTVDDPIITLGGDAAPTVNDGKDRGVEFRYYDTQDRLGFYGWDASISKYHFLESATNSSEVFSGTDAGIVAGNLQLTTNTGSTSTTTGTLVVTGGAGISQNIYVGGNSVVSGNSSVTGTLEVTDIVTLNSNVTINGSDTLNSEFFKIRNGSSVDKFVVESSTGNTTIAGTLGVTGATTVSGLLNANGGIAVDTNRFTVADGTGNTSIAGTLGVTGATTLSSTLDVTGVTTLTGNLITQSGSYITIQNTDAPTIVVDGSNNYVISGSDYGAFRNNGGGYFGQDVLFAQDIFVNGAINVKDAGDGGTASTVNSLSVRYRTSLGTTLAYTPSFATDTNSNLRVVGGAGISTTLHIGGTSAGQGLFVGKRLSGDTAKFSVLGATGNTSIAGTLGVTGATTLSSTLDVTGVTTLSSSLNVTGNTTLTGDLAVNGGDLTTTQSTFNLLNATATTLNIGGAATSLTIGATTGTLTIRNANTVISGNLTVNGTTTTVNSTTITVDDPIITLGGDTAPASDDNKDRGIEFRYFDLSAKVGFFGWDDSSSGYRFLENATNISEVFSGTDAALYAGSLSLSKNTGSTSTTTGTLVVTGGVGISQNIYIGGTTNLTGQLTASGGSLLNSIRVGITSPSTIDTGSGSLTLGNTIIGTSSSNTLVVNATATFNTDIAGTARDARQWTTARTVSLSTDASGSVSIDGSGNVTLPVTLANTGVAAGTYRSVTVDSKGRVTNGTNPTTLSGYGITDAQPLDSDLTAVAGLTTTGFISRTGTGSAATRSIVVSGIGLSITNADGISGDPTITSNATPNNSANSIVSRDANRNFTANIITASLNGNASTATKLETARNIAGTAFDGSADINISYNNLTNIPTAFTTNRIATATAPASATATGTAGEVRYDSNYIYVCVATNTWKRTALASW